MQDVSSDQKTLLARLQQSAPAPLEVSWDNVRGVARSIRGVLAGPGSTAATSEQIVDSFLAAYGALFGPPDIARWLTAVWVDVDAWQWTHRQLQQTHEPAGLSRALDVWGSKLAAHLDAERTLREVQSSCWREVAVDTMPRLDVDALRDIVRTEAARRPGFAELERRMGRVHGFPLLETPRLVIYPWQGRFRLAWTTCAYAGPELEAGEVFVDAVSGELFLFSPLGMNAEVPAVGSGFGVTPVAPVGGPYVLRQLQIVQDAVAGKFYLKDTTHARDLITFDADLDAAWTSEAQIAAGLAAAAGDLAGTPLPVSENQTSGWNRTLVPSGQVTRGDSQQPEVDAHFIVGQVYEWYGALEGGAGRAGWDNGQHSDPPVKPNLPVRVVTHVWPPTATDAGFLAGIVGNYWYPFIYLNDCDPPAHCPSDAAPAPNRALDYFAGSANIVAHEYQHGITTFSFVNGTRPGFGNVGWAGAVHEGLSDAFGALYSNVWGHGPEISTAGLVIRNAAFPRDAQSWDNRPGGPPCGLERQDRDHFDDRDPPQGAAISKYARGTILSHCAYLMGRGGVHQRASRLPALIPVPGLGHETVGGKLLARTARIWYLALTQYFSNIGTTTGIPANDASMFRAFRDACVSAADQLYGAGSRESATTKLAFYAVGLRPPGVPYGADVTFLRWGHAWELSRPHLGGLFATCPDWASLDLFIDNGAGFGWEAVVNTLDSAGNPTQHENSVYCRVRNVGDQAAQNVVVDLSYAKLGTAPIGWQPVTDRNGVVQQINVGALAAGQSSFSDAAQLNPPASARARWYIPPLAPGEVVDHFCLRARVTAANDVNPHNNEVQSNLAHIAFQLGRWALVAFMAGNPTGRSLPLVLRVRSELPPEWEVTVEGDQSPLAPHEQRPMRLRLRMGAAPLEAPAPSFSATITGSLLGPLTGRVQGALIDAQLDGTRLRGRISLALDELGYLSGDFNGRLTSPEGGVVGRVTAGFQNAATGKSDRVGVILRGRVRPWLRVHVSQLAAGETLGGFSVQIEPPRG